MTPTSRNILLIGGAALALLVLANRNKRKSPAIGGVGDVPERVDGIPTGRTAEDIKKRREIVKKEYLKLCDRLQGKGVYNLRLGEYINVKYKHGGHKATNNATEKWQNTYAVKHLEEILSGATIPGAAIELLPPKDGNQRRLGYIGVFKMYYTFQNEKPYLNFTVEVVIGVRKNGEKYEYCTEIK